MSKETLVRLPMRAMGFFHETRIPFSLVGGKSLKVSVLPSHTSIIHPFCASALICLSIAWQHLWEVAADTH